jgi:putative protease
MIKSGTFRKEKPELLAPAGSLETALSAYSSGADAVYLGLDRYNARIPAENFTLEQVSKLAAYAKKHGKKYYLTLNTLLKEGELEDAVDILDEVETLEPDGIIVQDLGVVRLLRSVFPSLAIHASTQMGIHNSAGVAVAARMGVERVILERQVSLEELEQIVRKAETEIEVFIHGALCCSISGRCLFSSWIGGWSGNRGRCKQPCRRRYYTGDGNDKKGGFFFSTQDLYSLDLIPDLKRIGVASLKIEGRLKKAHYVQSVVSAYRMMIDAPEEESESVLKQAKLVLSGSYGRRWSHGFARGEDFETVLQPASIGVSGLLIGELLDVRSGSLRLRLDRRLHVGDRIRIQARDGKESPSFTVRELTQRGKPVKSCGKGQVEIPVDREVKQGSLVYKVGESVKKAGPSPDGLSYFEPRPKIDMRIRIGRGGFRVEIPFFSEEGKGNKGLKWEKSLQLPEAKKHSIDGEEVRRVFGSLGSGLVQAGLIKIEVEEGLFLPPSVLKKIRREFRDYLEAFIRERGSQFPDPRSGRESARERFLKLHCSGVVPESEQRLRDESPEVSCAGRGPKKGSCEVKVDSLYSYDEKTDEVELPHFCAENALETVTKKIREAVKAGVRRFRVSDVYQFELLSGYRDIKLSTGFPLPVTNSLAAEEVRSLGAEKVQVWVELDKKGIEEMADNTKVMLEIYRHGRPFILVTRARVDADGQIKDQRGRTFSIEFSSLDRLTYLYPYEVLSLPAMKGFSEFHDFRRTGTSEQVFSSFNYETEFV